MTSSIPSPDLLWFRRWCWWNRLCAFAIACNHLIKFKLNSNRLDRTIGLLNTEWINDVETKRFKPAARTRMIPQPRDQHHPTRQKMTVMACNKLTTVLTRRARRRCPGVTWQEKRGAPQQTANIPLRKVPSHFPAPRYLLFV